MFETKEITIGNDAYTLKKFPTIEGLKIRKEFYGMLTAGDPVPPVDFQVKVICAGATVNSIQIDQKKFETHFRGKYDDIDELFTEILDFNFQIKAEAEGNESNATAE